MHSFVSSSLLIPSRVFFISVIVFLSSDRYFLYFLVPCQNSHCVHLFFSQVQLAFLLLLL